MDLYRLTIQDSQDTMQFDLLDAPINIEDVEGAVDNTVLSGDIFTDFLYLKKRWEQKWAIMCKDEYERLRGFYTRQWSLATVPSVKVTQGYLKNTEWEGQIIYINAPYGGEIDGLTKMTGDTFQQSYTGKNLFNKNDVVVGYIANGSGEIIYRGDTRSSQFFAIEPGSTYIASGQPHGFTVVGYYDADRNFIERPNSVPATTAPANAYYARVTCIAADLDTCQFEKGATATSYEPYVGGVPSPNPDYPQPIRTVTGTQTITINGQAFTIDLGNIELCKLGDSQDSIYYDGANWTLEKQTITRQFNGDDTDINTQGWFNSGDTNATTQVVAINCRTALDGKFSEEDKSLMTHFYHVSGNLTPVSNGMFKTLTGSGFPDSIVYVRIAIAKSIAPDFNGAKAWIAANKPTLCMPKLTPIQTTITDQALIAQLEAVRAALIEGQNLVEVTANGSNLPAKSITLQGVEGRENPILPQTNVRISLSDGGVLNACECRQNVTLSMRETA